MDSSMRRTLFGALLVLALLVFAPQAGAGGTGNPMLTDAESFAFGIGNGMIEGNAR